METSTKNSLLILLCSIGIIFLIGITFWWNRGWRDFKETNKRIYDNRPLCKYKIYQCGKVIDTIWEQRFDCFSFIREGLYYKYDFENK